MQKIHLPPSANDNTPREDRRRPPGWEFTTDIIKVTFFNRALIEMGTPYAISLNLSPEVIRVAMNDNSAGFMTHIHKRVRRHLKAELGREPAFWLIAEVTPGGRVHLHGGIAANDNEPPAVERALSRAGGKWQGRGSEYQVDVRVEYHPDGWANYCEKDMARTKRVVPGSLVSVTRPLQRKAKELYTSKRSAITMH